jgi:hypothetical protein
MQSVLWIFATVATVVGLFAMLFVPALVLRRFVRPDDTCAPPRRFTTGDFIVLAMYLQFALAFGTWFAPIGEARHLQYLVTGLGCVSMTAVWFGAVEAVARTGIPSELKRGLFLIVLLPLTIAAMLGAGLAGPAMFWALADPHEALWGRGEVAWYLPFAVPALILGLHRLAWWLTKDIEKQPAPEPPPEALSADRQ